MKFVQMISFLKYDIIKMKAKCLGLNKFMKIFFITFSAPEMSRVSAYLIYLSVISILSCIF